MDIDLLISKTNDICLVATGRFNSTVTAAIFDNESHKLSLEFGETMETMDMNIPVSEEFVPYLIQRQNLFIIGTDIKHIHEAYQIPLMHINDYAAEEQSQGEWI